MTKNVDHKFTRQYDTFIPSLLVPQLQMIVVKNALKLSEQTLLVKAAATGNKGEVIIVSLYCTKRIPTLWMPWEYWQEN